MPCPYAELANKIEIHDTIDGSPGYYLSKLEIRTIIEALRYTSDWKLAIEAADSPDQQKRET